MKCCRGLAEDTKKGRIESAPDFARGASEEQLVVACVGTRSSSLLDPSSRICRKQPDSTRAFAQKQPERLWR